MKYLDPIKKFFKNKKHIEAIVLAVIFIIVIAVSASRVRKLRQGAASGDASAKNAFILTDASGNSTQKSTVYKKEKRNSNLHDLLTEYYKYYADGNTSKIESVASPVSDMEKSYIKFMGSLIDSYDIKEIYTKDGAEKGARFVSVYEQIHFKGLKSAAPGLDFFYVEKDKSGGLHINNLYSSFNQTNKENDMDPKVVSAIASFEEQKDVVSLQTKVQKEYNEISLSDKKFESFMSKTFPAKVKAWQLKYRKEAEKAEAAARKKAAEKAKKKAAEDKKKAEEAKKKAEEAKKKSDSDKKSKDTSESTKPKGDQYKTTTETNLRKSDSVKSDIIKTLKKGTTVTKKGTKGKWLKVSYKGKTGYIRKEYVKKVKSAKKSDSSSSDKSKKKSSSEKKSSSDKKKSSEKKKSSDKKKSKAKGPKAGKTIMLMDTYNIRKSPSSSAKRIHLAYKGEKVTVISNQSDGWTKVACSGKIGYIKTEYLK
ncbi:MAG: SH3 domain-containing protein [Lachnospiraceae bacterium]|nr:MAG: SH3 domain-containing protein [Lachnospiraceae bacterium]